MLFSLFPQPGFTVELEGTRGETSLHTANLILKYPSCHMSIIICFDTNDIHKRERIGHGF